MALKTNWLKMDNITPLMPLSAGFLGRGEPLDETLYLGYFKGRVLIDQEMLVWVKPDPNGLQVFLGNWNGVAIFAQDLSHLVELPGDPTDLWLLPNSVPKDHLALLCQGQHMLRWHAKNRFCAKTGTPTELQDFGRSRRSEIAKTDIYPRIDPAVIMLVLSPDKKKVVLANSKLMPPGLHSLLAGYVEPGEALEDTVRRETIEEVGLNVSEVTYLASQPWALSGSLMVGFTCVATSWEIQIDADELETADWFSHKDLLRLKNDPAYGFPRRNTIARHMLDQWRETQS